MLELALTLATIFFAIYLIGKWKIFQIEGISISVFKGLFIIKIIAALALYVIYTQYYKDREYADIFRYYDDSEVIYNTLFSTPWISSECSLELMVGHRKLRLIMML